MSAWRVIQNYPLYEVNRKGEVKEVLTGRKLISSRNRHGEHYHLESPSGRIVAVKKADLITWEFPKE
ncbi:HNH endonuclease [Arthrobacter phage Tokki]|nr:HNH endonuclease [Arthrobacter phage Tokki]